MSATITVRKCTALEDFRRCVELQRQVWGEDDLEVEPATTFVVATHTGGQVLGAFEGDKLVGYTLAVVGLRDREIFLHSHMTGVLPEYRDRGVGRMLKLFQREDALSRDIRLVVWTFDPLELRNAHFNLNRLGAIARKYYPNLYGVTSSPLHRGLATDRLVAEWRLDSARVITAVGEISVEPPEAPATIELPAELENWQHDDSPEVARVQARIREEFLNWFGKGYAAVAVQKKGNGTAYLLTPRSDF